MKTKKISDSELSERKIAKLPNRPTAPSGAGGGGYTATEMKERFDALPMLAVERINSLIDDIRAPRDSSIAQDIKTGIEELHTLAQFFIDVENGTAASYISVGNRSLSQELEEIKEAIRAVGGKI